MKHYVFFIEFLFFDFAVLAWGFWQLRSLRRDSDEARRKDADHKPPSGKPG